MSAARSAGGMEFGTIPANDVLTADCSRLKVRPAFQATNAKDTALIPETKT